MHILHPVHIGLGEALGNKLDPSLFHHPDGLFGQGLHLDEPLGRGDGLHGGAAAVAGAHIVAVILGFHQSADGVQIGQNGLAGFIPVHPLVFAAVFVDLGVVVQDQNLLQAVTLAHVKVVGVMAGCDLDAAGAEVLFHIIIGENGQQTAYQGQDGVLAMEMSVTLIFRVDGNAGIAQNGLRTGGGNDHVLPGFLDFVLDVPQMALLLAVFHLCIGQSGSTVGAPVDDPAAPVDQALFIQILKGLTHRFGAAFVHGEAAAAPVGRSAQLLLLIQNSSAVFFLPLPDPAEKFLPAQVIAGLVLLLPQVFFHLDLSGDAGVVHAGHPQSLIALHPLLADDGVLNGHIKSVTHVQLPCHIGGRHDDAVRLLILVHFGFEAAAFLPKPVDAVFGLFGIVDLFQFLCHIRLHSFFLAVWPRAADQQKTSAPCCYGTEVNIHFRGTTHICVKKRTLRRQTAPFPLTRARRRGLLCPKGGSACGSGTTFPRRLGSTSTNRALSMPLHRDTPALHSLYTRDIIRSPLPFCQEQKKGRLPK